MTSGALICQIQTASRKEWVCVFVE